MCRPIVWLFLSAACSTAAADDPADKHSFTRSSLVHRFDADGNGKLEGGEVAAARGAYGGVQIPMLPDSPVDYLTVQRPEHVTSADTSGLDNTPTDNPTTNAGATLGRVLFYDKQLSRNNTVACASCHMQLLGFADPRQFSIGFEKKTTRRNAMGLINVRFTHIHGNHPGFFWDERAATLEQQVLMPIQDAIEMGMTLDELESRLTNLPYYPPLFTAAFGSPQVNRDRIARSIAQFLRSMESWDSKFDRAAARAGAKIVLDEPFEDFTPEENLGKALFVQGIEGVAEFSCAHCHVPPTFGMAKAVNNGLDLVSADAGLGETDRPLNDPFTPSNDGKFKAPSLRNIELTAPYMHDGRFKTLEQTVDHYGQGVRPHENLALAFLDDEGSEGLKGYRYSAQQKAGLVAFLKTLTDRTFINDGRFADPFLVE